jgi:sterol desaturase/sphingolipid hydroxylase (fatty acid hydroxylase superfamily)
LADRRCGASFVARFLLMNLLSYLVHRCEHAVPLVWRFHALHHSDPDVDLTTSLRHHLIEYPSLGGLLDRGDRAQPATAVLIHALAVFATSAVERKCPPAREAGTMAATDFGHD